MYEVNTCTNVWKKEGEKEEKEREREGRRLNDETETALQAHVPQCPLLKDAGNSNFLAF